MNVAVDLSSPPATARERRLARATAALFAVATIAAAPFAKIRLGESLPFFALLQGASALAMIVTAVLLATQARATRSRSLSILAGGYAYTSLAMCLNIAFYPGLFPTAAPFVHAQAGASSWFWIGWHSSLLLAILAYRLVRRYPLGPLAARRTALWAAAGAFALTVTFLFAPLPSLGNPLHTGPSALFTHVIGPLQLVAAFAVVIVLYTMPGRTLLDCWLVTASAMIALDVTLAYLSQGRFTFGWYVSRLLVLGAATTLLTVLLAQVARMYAKVAHEASELSTEAATDALTGLPNRRRTIEFGEAAVLQAQAQASPLALAFVDVDAFKHYNDTFGHAAGDACLRAVARTVAEAIRSGDFLGRFGGEEFVLVLRDAEASAAFAIAERAREAVDGIRLGGVAPRRTSISVGVAFLQPDDTFDTVLARADAAMYAAKRAGGDRTLLHDGEGPVAPRIVAEAGAA